jgi:hypothetical protein
MIEAIATMERRYEDRADRPRRIAQPAVRTRVPPRSKALSQGLFSSLSEEERHELVAGWVGVGVTLAATAFNPLFMLAAGPLQILARRVTDMWIGDGYRPARAFAVGGRQATVQYGSGGVQLNATPLFRRSAIATQEIAGQFSAYGFRNQALRRGDPVALVLSDASWRSQNDGLVVPARFGDSFALWVPRGKYNLSAYSLDPRGRPKVDPVSAIGVKSVTRSSRPGSASVVLRPRGVPFTRSTISESLNHRAAHPGSLHKCPYCSALQFLELPSCWKCGRFIAGAPPSRIGQRPQRSSGPPLPAMDHWRCTFCGKMNLDYQFSQPRRSTRRTLHLCVFCHKFNFSV